MRRRSYLGIVASLSVFLSGIGISGASAIPEEAEEDSPAAVAANANWEGPERGSVQGGDQLEIPILTGEGFVDADMQGNHTLAYDKDGNLWAWGDGKGFVLGTGDSNSRTTPVKSDTSGIFDSGFSAVNRVSAGGNFSTAMVVDNSSDIGGSPAVWGIGMNGLNQGAVPTIPKYPNLGSGNFLPTTFTQLEAGTAHAVGIATRQNEANPTVWTYGANSNGELGVGNTSSQSALSRALSSNGQPLVAHQASAGNGFSVAFNANTGRFYQWGRGIGGLSTTTYGSLLSGVYENVTEISAGDNHVLALTESGRILSWGSNSAGQLGRSGATNVPTYVNAPSNVVFTSISAGGEHSLAVDSEGKVWSWGSNYYGQLGGGTQGGSTTVPTQRTWSNLPQGTLFKSVAASENGSIFISEKGVVWGVGSNSSGQLGNGQTSGIQLTPVAAKLDLGTAKVFLGNEQVGGSFSVDVETRSINVTMPRHKSGTYEVFLQLNNGAKQSLGFYTYALDLELTATPSPASVDDEVTLSASVSSADRQLIGSGATVDFTVDSPLTGTTNLTGVALSNGVATAKIRSDEVTSDAKISAVVKQGGMDVSNNAETSITFGAGAPSCGVNASKLTVSPANGVIADGQSVYKVTAKVVSAKGTPLENIRVKFAPDAGLSADGDVEGTTNADGIFEVGFSANSTGIYNVAATLEDYSSCKLGNSPVKLEYIAGEISPGDTLTRIEAIAGTAKANGTDQRAAKVTVTDKFGNKVKGAQITFALDSNLKLASGQTMTATSDASGEATVKVTSTKVGTWPVTAKVKDPVTGTVIDAHGKADLKFDNSDPEFGADKTRLEGETRVALANDGDQLKVKAYVIDKDNNPIAGADVVFAADTNLHANVDLSQAQKTGADGSVEILFTSAKPGKYPVSAKVGGTEVYGSPVYLSYKVGDVDLGNDKSTYWVTDDTKTVMESHTVTVTLADSSGNPIDGLANNLMGTAGGGAQVSTFKAGTNSGEYIATVTSTTPGDKNINVSYTGAPVDARGKNTVARFVTGPIDPSHTNTFYTVSDGTRVANGQDNHKITVSLADGKGNPVTGKARDIDAVETTSESKLLVGTFSETGTAGMYEATVRSTKSGKFVFNVSVKEGSNTSKVNAKGNFVAQFIAGNPDLEDKSHSNYDVTTGTALVNTGTHRVTVKLADIYGNPVNLADASQLGNLVATAEPNSGVTIGGFAAGTSEGSYVAEIRSSVAGSKNITVKYSGADVKLIDGGNSKATFEAGAVDPDHDETWFTVSTGDQVVGTGTHKITVNLVDSNGNAVGKQAAYIVAKADPSEKVEVGSFTETSTTGLYEATVKSTLPGKKKISVNYTAESISLRSNASVQGPGNDIAAFIVGAVSQDKSSYWVTDGEVSVDGGYHEVNVTLKDDYGNLIADAANLLSATSSANGPKFTAFTQKSEGVYVARITSNVAGEFTISTNSEGTGPLNAAPKANKVARFISGGPSASRSTYTVSDGEIVVGSGVHTITVDLRDVNGNPVYNYVSGLVPATDQDLGLGSFSEFSPKLDAEGRQTGKYVATVSSTVDGDKEIVVKLGGNALGYTANKIARFKAGSVDPSNPGTYFEVSKGDKVADGSDSHKISVYTVDRFGNSVNPTDTLIASTASDLGIGVVSPLTRIATGHYEASVTSTKAGLKTIKVTMGAVNVIYRDTPNVNFVAGKVDLIDNAHSNFTVSTGEVSVEGGSHQISVKLADKYDNPVSLNNADLAKLVGSAANLGSGSITSFDEISAGNYTATITSSVPGDKTVSVKYDGNTVKLKSAGNDVAKFQTGGPYIPHEKTYYEVSEGTVTVGQNHTVTVHLVDFQGNPVDGYANDLVGIGKDGAVVSQFKAGTNSGEYVAKISATTPGNKEITVQFGGSDIDNRGHNKIARFKSGTVDPTNPQTYYRISEGERIANGQDAHSITVSLADAYGNPVSDQAAAINAQAKSSLGQGLIGQFTASSTPGIYTAPVTSTIAGDISFAMRWNDGATAHQIEVNGNFIAKFVAGDAELTEKSTYQVTVGAALVETGTHYVSVTLKDANENPIILQGVTELSQLEAAANPGAGVSIGRFTSTAVSGVYRAPITSTSSGEKQITATYRGETVNPNGNTIALFESGAVDPDDPETWFTVSEGEQPVGIGTHTITVKLVDRNQNPVSGQAQALSSEAIPGNQVSFSAFSETSSPGTYEASVTSRSAGEKVIRVKHAGSSISVRSDSHPDGVGNDKALFVAGAVNDYESGYTVTRGEVSVEGGEHAITVNLRDIYGNPVVGKASSLQATGSPNGALVGTFVDGGDGSYRALITSNTAGKFRMTVIFGGYTELEVEAGGNRVAAFVAGGVSLDNSNYDVTTGILKAGTGSHFVTATLKDKFGNAVTGNAAVLSAQADKTLGQGSIGTFVELLDADSNPTGVYRAAIWSTSAGDKEISVFVGGSTIAHVNNKIARFSAADLSIVASNYAVTEGTRIADGADSHTITVNLRDRYQNPISGKTNTLSVITAPTTVNSPIIFTETSTGIYEATVTTTVAGNKAVEVAVSGVQIDSAGENTIARFVAGSPSAANSTYRVTDGNIVADGKAAHTITAVLRDKYNNLVTLRASEIDNLVANAVKLGSGRITQFSPADERGEYTSLITSTVAGNKPVSLSYDSQTIYAGANNLTAKFIASTVDVGNAGTKFEVDTKAGLANGQDRVEIRVWLADANGNPVSLDSTGIEELNASTSQNLGTGKIGVFTETSEAGKYIASVSSSVVGAKTIKVTSGSANIQSRGGNDKATFVTTGVDPTNPKTMYTVSEGTRVANGTDSHLVTINLYDMTDNPVVGQESEIKLSADPNAKIVFGGMTVVSDGVYEVEVTSTKAQTSLISVNVGDKEIKWSNNRVAKFIAGEIDFAAEHTNYVVSAGEVVADGQHGHTVTAHFADSFDNPVTLTGTQLTTLQAATSADLGLGQIGGFVQVFGEEGTYRSIITSTIIGDKEMSVKLGALKVQLKPQGNKIARFIVGEVDYTHVNTGYVVSDGVQPVESGSHTVTVTLSDSLGNLIGGQASKIKAIAHEDLGGGTVADFIEVDAGVYTAKVTSTVAGDKTFAVSYKETALSARGRSVATFGPNQIDPSKTEFTNFTVTTGQEVVGTGAHTITVNLADTFGNPVSNMAEQIVATADPSEKVSFTEFVENKTQPGTYIGKVSAQLEGTKSVFVNVGTLSIQVKPKGGNDRAVFVAGPLDLNAETTGYTVTSGIQPVDMGSHTITVTTTDTYGNIVDIDPASLWADTASDLGEGSITEFQRIQPGYYQANITSSKNGSKPITVSYTDGSLVTAMVARGNDTAVFGGEDSLVPLGKVNITGETVVYNTLSAYTSGWQNGTTFTYQWYVDGKAVTGATGKTFVIPARAVGKYIYVEATGSHPNYTTPTTASSSWVGPVKPKVTRLSGQDRYETANAVAERFGESGKPVFIATGMIYADALTAAPAIAKLDGTLLLTRPDSLPQATREALQALKPSKIYIVGQTTAINKSVENEIRKYSSNVERVGGKDRYETSLLVLNKFYSSASSAFIATGNDYPDALVASAAAGLLDAPIVLVPGKNNNGATPNVIRQLKNLGVKNVHIAGGESVVVPKIASTLRGNFSVTRHGGADRYETAVKLNKLFGNPEYVEGLWIATGRDFPDSLSAAVPAARFGHPLYLVTPNCVPQGTLAAINNTTYAERLIAGGSNAVGYSVGNLSPTCGR